ncbi:hypothetical protein B1C78_17160 [Thioalkalivibrio denitrificans]|uniref:Exo-alpha-sialidase n=1 Tax=Thioalkalivibrio denitrificans TaxID=108003 RepID=A0A1V3N6A8_9GAMM|nr:hypothetical protein B1C78_17160 [Thioalkalivibrio denitrificans]
MPRTVLLAAAVAVGLVVALQPALVHSDDLTLQWEPPLEVASGEAFRGPWRMNDSDFRFVDDPAVSINDQGVIAVAWADQARQELFVQLYDPDGTPRLAELANVSRSSGIFSWLPRIVLTDGDAPSVYVLWQDIVFSGGSHGGEIFFSASFDGGRTFSEPVNLSNTTAGAGKGRLSANYWHNGSLDLAMGPEGQVYAAWTEYEGALWFSRSVDAGRSFTEPLRIAGAPDALPARGPSLAVEGDTVYLAWTVGEDPSADIHITRSTDAGETFESPRTVAAGPGHADAPKLAVDAEGVVHLVFAEGPDGPAGPYRVRYTRATDRLDFERSRVIAGPARGDVAMVHFPHLDVDREGRVYVLWERFPHRRGRPLGLGYTWSADGGASFAAPRVLAGSDDPRLGANGSQQGLLMRKLALNASGRAAVVNSSFMPGETSHVWLFRGHFPDSP